MYTDRRGDLLKEWGPTSTVDKALYSARNLHTTFLAANNGCFSFPLLLLVTEWRVVKIHKEARTSTNALLQVVMQL